MSQVQTAQAELDQLLETERRLASPADFMEWASGGKRQAFPHLRLVSDEIVGMVEQDTCDVLVVELPVRHGKSELCSRFAPVWYLANYPDQVVGLASYEADFAAGWGRKARDLMEEVGAEFGLKVSSKSSAANRWGLDGHDGHMWTAGAGGPATGKGWDFGILDDPVKNAEEANSQSERDKVDEWLEKVWLTRRQGIGKLVIPMSRWHFDDVVGRLKVDPRGLRVRTVRLPALAEDDDPLGREVGEPLCPELMPLDRLEQAKRTSAWGPLYQQSPVASEGAMFNPESFRRYMSEETDGRRVLVLLTEVGRKVWSADECGRFATVDLAVSTKTSADWTVVLSCAVTPESDLVVLGLVRTRVESHRHVDLVADALEQHGLGWAGVESVTFGLSLIQAARRKGLPVRKLKADKDKVSRARPAQAMVEGGQVYLPQGAPWVDDFIRECVEFPLGRHDDQVDCLAYACAEVAQGYVRARRQRPKATGESYDEKVWRLGRKRLDKRDRAVHPVLGRL